MNFAFQGIVPSSVRHPPFVRMLEPDLWSSRMTNWAVPEFSRNQVDKAGFTLIDENASDEEHRYALRIINNWRSAHSYPLLHFRINLARKVKNIQPDAIIAQRIKRLESISYKLRRQSTQLSQMQDIGGCRAIVKSVDEVIRLAENYKKSTFSHEFKGEKDYISNPKADGYRSRHLIYHYKSARGQKIHYDKLRLEVQIRTSLQHAWATAVEAVGVFTRQALKANMGNQDWLRLFALMSAQIAHIEGTPIVPDTPDSEVDRLKEIKMLASSLRAVQTLEAYRATVNYVGKLSDGSKYYLVEYDYNLNTVNVTPFSNRASQRANSAYTAAETSVSDGSKNVVLVSVDTINNLQKAYPNYFLDTDQFTQLLTACLKT